MDIRAAVCRMTSACARTIGRANPVTTMIEVMKRPRSTAAEPSYSAEEKSSAAQWEKIAFGNGATTKVNAMMTTAVSGRAKVDCQVAYQRGVVTSWQIMHKTVSPSKIPQPRQRKVG